MRFRISVRRLAFEEEVDITARKAPGGAVWTYHSDPDDQVGAWFPVSLRLAGFRMPTLNRM